MTRSFTAAVCPFTAGDDVDAALAEATRLVRAAADAGADLCALPEMWSYYGPPEGARAAADGMPERAVDALGPIAADAGMVLAMGTVFAPPEAAGLEPDPDRVVNLQVVLDAGGAEAARYAKMHLFDVDVPGRAVHRESDVVVPGPGPVRTTVDIGTAGPVEIGLMTCYDLRFPAMAEALAGCPVLLAPSAFAEGTGRDHWHLLVRARAVEAQAVVIAADQWGEHPNGMTTYGHGLVVGPWGDVLAEVEPGAREPVIARVDLDAVERVRRELPALEHRRPTA